MSTQLIKKFYMKIRIKTASFVHKLKRKIPHENGRNKYKKWLSTHDNYPTKYQHSIQVKVNALPLQPLISIVMPTYNSDPAYLRAALESVLNQLYENWELCIADDNSSRQDTLQILKEYAEKDPRIKVVFRASNGNISAASNSALECASGEFIALLDHDDVLASHALAYVVQTFNEHPEAKLIYSDEDKLNEKGERFDHYFKPDWNYDLLLSQNYINHFGVYQRNLINSIGNFRLGFEGAQDYDLVLRCIEKLSPQEIVHIPFVLYHWRAIPESTALSADAKAYALLAARKAIQEHLQRLAIDAVVEAAPDLPQFNRVRYALPKQPPLTSIIIPTHNRLDLLQTCISSILYKTTYSNYEIIIIDNRTNEPSCLEYLAKLEKHPKCKVIRDNRPFNYSAINNAAIPFAQGEILAFLNNDIEIISPDWLKEMVSHAVRPQIGAVGAKLFYPNNTLQHNGVIIGLGGVAGHIYIREPANTVGYFGRAMLLQNFSAVTAACLVVRKNLFLEAKGFDEESLAVAFNDVDLCLKIQALGYRNLWTPYAKAYHHESATRGSDTDPDKIERFKREFEFMKKKWKNIIEHDPAYNPNLTLDFSDSSLAYRPRTKKYCLE